MTRLVSRTWFPANSNTSAVMYSTTAAKYTAAVGLTRPFVWLVTYLLKDYVI